MTRRRFKRTIGRFDRVDFPELGLVDIDAKIDTGAFSSAIHCHNIVRIEEQGKSLVRFNLLDPTHPAYDEKEIVMPVFDIVQVRSSTGHAEERIQVSTPIVLFNTRYLTILNLSSRGDMRFPVLLGRRLLSHNFVVDVARVDLSYRYKVHYLR